MTILKSAVGKLTLRSVLFYLMLDFIKKPGRNILHKDTKNNLKFFGIDNQLMSQKLDLD